MCIYSGDVKKKDINYVSRYWLSYLSKGKRDFKQTNGTQDNTPFAGAEFCMLENLVLVHFEQIANQKLTFFFF